MPGLVNPGLRIIVLMSLRLLLQDKGAFFIMNYKFDKCSECVAEGNSNNTPIVNRRHMLCAKHNRIRLDLQQGKKPGNASYNRFSKTFEYCTEWGFKKEMDMYVHIWNTRPHVSWLTGRPVQFHPACFLHVLAKGLNKYPHYRLNPDNVILGTRHEHHLIDNGTSVQIEKYKKENPNFAIEAFDMKKQKLKTEYLSKY